MLLNVCTSIIFGTMLTEDVYNENGILVGVAGWPDQDLPQRNMPVDGIIGGDRIVDLDSVPTEQEIISHLNVLKNAIDDPNACTFRRIYVGQDSDGNYTQIMRDVWISRL